MSDEILKQVRQSIFRGLLDSVAFHRGLVLIVKSEKVRVRVVQCLVLNGVIFLGSIFIFQNILGPLLRSGLGFLLQLESSEHTLDVMQAWIEWIYFLLWIVPVYLLSFILNTLWYQDIARESMRVFPPISTRSAASSSSISSGIVQVIFRSLFNLIFLLYLCLLYRWKWVYAINLAWLVAYNAFEYRWIADKLTFDEKINLFEKNYIYFMFFGIGTAIFAVQFPAIVENGLISLVLPFHIMSASTAGNPPVISVPKSLPWLDRTVLSWLERFPVLLVPESITKFLIIATKRFI